MSKYKIYVEKTTRGTFSHQLHCLCHTIGMSHEVERAYILVKVNFYKFREYMETTAGVINWFDWHTENRYSITFLKALSNYINETQGRNTYYIQPDELSRKLDCLLNECDKIAIQLKHLNNKN